MTTLAWKKCIYILKKNIYIYIYILYTILTNFDHPYKNVKQHGLRITRIWIQLNNSISTSIIFSQ